MDASEETGRADRDRAWRSLGFAARREISKKPQNIGALRPTGLKIDWFETQLSPGFDILARGLAEGASKMLFHQRNKKVVAARTQNRPAFSPFAFSPSSAL